MKKDIECAVACESDHNTKTPTAKDRRLAFIVNPTAGSGKCPELFERAKKIIDESGAQYEVFPTLSHGHAESLAASCVQSNFDAIVAVGGDGTVREVVSVLFKRADEPKTCVPVLGILPFGTGNDLASALSIPGEPEAAARLILNGKPKPMDIGFANGRIFTNVCGLGFDADVLAHTEKHKKGRVGMLPYLFGIADAILHKRRVRAYISLDGGEEQALDALIITACNGKRFGGGMLVAPKALPDDGLFDICISKYTGFFRLVSLLPAFIKGKHIGKKPVIYTRARRITVRTDGENAVQLDGDLIEKTPLECELIPDAVMVLRP